MRGVKRGRHGHGARVEGLRSLRGAEVDGRAQPMLGLGERGKFVWRGTRGGAGVEERRRQRSLSPNFGGAFWYSCTAPAMNVGVALDDFEQSLQVRLGVGVLHHGRLLVLPRESPVSTCITHGGTERTHD